MTHKNDYHARILLSVLAFFLLLPASIFAASADLDMTFGNGGKVITHVGEGGINAIAIQSDGKIVAAGTSRQQPSVPSGELTLTRYNADGSLDASFGNGGMVVTSIGNAYLAANSLAIQADGKIVVAGDVAGNIGGIYSQSDFVVVRYNPDGSRDSTFGSSGIVITPVGHQNDYARALAIQSDGRIVVAGSVGVWWDDDENIALVRYNTNGSRDPSFGAGGILADLGGSISNDPAHAVAIGSDGKIVAAGFRNGGFGLTRYNPNGSLDTSFGANGKVTTLMNGGGDAYGVLIQPDGKIVATGNSDSNTFALARYDPNGALDTSFGTGGKVLTNFGSASESPQGAAIQASGKIVVAGYDGFWPQHQVFVIARYNVDGSPDITFGSLGRATTQFSGNSDDSAHSVAVQADGKIVAAGFNYTETSLSFGLVRYLGDSVATRRTPFDFDGDGRSDISVFRTSDRVWYLNRSTAGFAASQFGASGDLLTPADFTGDGKTDVAVFRPSDGRWYVLRSEDLTFYGTGFGTSGDIPAPADYDGDGKADPAVYRPSDGTWYMLRSTAGFGANRFGVSEDRPAIGDFDGDGKADISVYRPSTGVWYRLNSSNGSFTAIQFGAAGDKVVPADYTGDGKTDIAVWRPSNGAWYVMRSEDLSFFGSVFGLSSDMPAPGDYDGDGKVDIAVYRPSEGIWYTMRSASGFNAVQFGTAEDDPAPGAFVY